MWNILVVISRPFDESFIRFSVQPVYPQEALAFLAEYLF
jgi:hypothetical protein